MLRKSCLKIERLNQGRPILEPTSHWWENGVTFNPAVMFIKRNEANVPLIEKLLDAELNGNPKIQDGVVAVQYRARPLQDTNGRLFNPSYTGLAIFNPEMELIHRHQSPVIMPGENEGDYDYLGVEDGRLHHFDSIYYYLYCGVSNWDNPEEAWSVKARLCLAKSRDLINWEKLGPIAGNVNTKEKHNKDGVFFPEKIDGKYFMLHRPCHGTNYSTYAISLAAASEIEGPWTDLGIIKYSDRVPLFARHAWPGAGAVPMPIGDKRYLVIYHRGHYLPTGERWYDLHAAIFNFNRFDPLFPERILEKRLERILTPETPHEMHAVQSDGVNNIVFTCGCYEYNGFLYIVYGGADCCTLAARINMDYLLDMLENTETLDLETAKGGANG